MGSLKAASDDRLAADLLWQMKAIATKEVTSSSMTPIKKKRKTSFTLPRIISTTLSISSFESLDHHESSSSPPPRVLSYSPPAASTNQGRSRTVSVGSIDSMIPSIKNALGHHGASPSTTRILIKLSPRPSTPSTRRIDSFAEQNLDHFDWSSSVSKERDDHAGSPDNTDKNNKACPSSSPLLVRSPLDLLKQVKNSKRKREGFVGTATKPNVPVRGTLRKKFSWKQYPELEEYLLSKQKEYFEYSSKNYTAEQRKYNNGLTRGLLDLAAEDGYLFEEFTFSMIRDRIRCYYKSHSQLAKKKRQR